MKLKKDQLKKIDNGRFYTIIDGKNPEYTSKELEKATGLTNLEYECISGVVDEDVRHKEQVIRTMAIFNKTAFIDYGII